MKLVFPVVGFAFLFAFPVAAFMGILFPPFPPIPPFASVSTMSSTTTIATTTTTTKWTTTTAKPWTTTRYPTTTPGSRGFNLKGKMVTLSQKSAVTFYSPNNDPDVFTTTYPRIENFIPATAKTTTTTAKTTTTTAKTTTTTAKPTTTMTAPTSGGVSVCLRFMADSSSLTLFTLSPYSSLRVYLYLENSQRYSLCWNNDYPSSVSLSPMIPVWPSVHTGPWTSICVVMDFYKNVAQIFQGGSMSIRKILPSRFEWSRQPAVQMSNFDGQVMDLEVWDFPLQNQQVYWFMQNYGSSGSFLTWSNILYRNNGIILVEDEYALGQSPQIMTEGEKQPMRSGQGRDRRLPYRKMLRRWMQMRREMF